MKYIIYMGEVNKTTQISAGKIMKTYFSKENKRVTHKVEEES